MEVLTTILLLFARVPAPAVPDAPVVFAETQQGKVQLLVDTNPRTVLVWNGKKVAKASLGDTRGVTLIRAGRDAFTLGSGPLPGQMTGDQHVNRWRLVHDAKNPKSVRIEVSPAGTETWQAPLDDAASQPGEFKAIMADEIGYVWVSTPKSVLCIDPRNAKNFWTWTSPQPITALDISLNGNALVGLADGSIYEVARGAKGAGVSRNYTPKQLPAKPIRAIHTDGDGYTWVVIGSEIYRAAPPADAWQRNWKALARMPVSDHDIFSGQLDGKLYIFGGMGSYGYPTVFKYYQDLFVFDTKKNRWDVVSSLPPARAYNGCAALDGRIWVIGGRVLGPTGQSGDTIPIDRVDIYDPKTGKWEVGPKLPGPRTEPVVVPVKGRIYVVGGSNGNDTLSIGPGEPTWRVEPAPPGGAFTQSSGCEIDGKIYVLSTSTHNVLRYDTTTRTWTELPKPPSDITLSAAISGAHKGEMWVMGGNTSNRLTFIYSPKTNAWRSGPELPTSLGWTSAQEVDGRLIVTPGGGTSTTYDYFIFTDRIYELRPAAESQKKP